MHSRLNWNLEVLVLKEREQPEYPEKNIRGKGENQQQTQLTYAWRQRQDLNPGHIGGRRVPSPLCHPCHQPPPPLLLSDITEKKYIL